jgi:hypothetical protein
MNPFLFAGRNLHIAIRRIWPVTLATSMACSPSPVVSPSPPASSASTAMPMNVPPPVAGWRGEAFVSAIEGHPVDNCFSRPLWRLLDTGHHVAQGPYSVFVSGSDIQLRSVFPIDDGAWSHYVDFVGTIDGQSFSMTWSNQPEYSPACEDGSDASGTLTDTMTGTLSADRKQFTATETRAYVFPWGSVTVHWEWTLAP